MGLPPDALCREKKPMVMGTSGNTQGVNVSSSPPRNESTNTPSSGLFAVSSFTETGQSSAASPASLFSAAATGAAATGSLLVVATSRTAGCGSTSGEWAGSAVGGTGDVVVVGAGVVV